MGSYCGKLKFLPSKLRTGWFKIGKQNGCENIHKFMLLCKCS